MTIPLNSRGQNFAVFLAMFQQNRLKTTVTFTYFFESVHYMVVIFDWILTLWRLKKGHFFVFISYNWRFLEELSIVVSCGKTKKNMYSSLTKNFDGTFQKPILKNHAEHWFAAMLYYTASKQAFIFSSTVRPRTLVFMGITLCSMHYWWTFLNIERWNKGLRNLR